MASEEKPKWLLQLKKLIHSTDDADKVALKDTLEKLKNKSNALKDEIDAADDVEKKQALIEQWEMVKKHRKKGIKKLKQWGER